MTQLARITPAEFNKAFVGFDTLFDSLQNRYANATATNYPPYNIAKYDDNLYEISIAVTGFATDEIEVKVEGDELLVTGTKADSETEEPHYLHRGLALRNFERKFTLIEHMKVDSAKVENGILSIRIERIVPEELLPKVIKVIDVNKEDK